MCHPFSALSGRRVQKEEDACQRKLERPALKTPAQEADGWADNQQTDEKQAGNQQADEAGAILSRSRQVLRRQAENAGCEDGLSPDSFPPADPPKE